MPATAPGDSYGAFRIKVKWRGRYVAGVNEVTRVERTAEALAQRGGGPSSDGSAKPGVAIALQRGVPHDAEFQKWVSQVQALVASTTNTREDITFDVHDDAGQVALSYKCHGCWPSEFVALPDLDASSSAVAIQSLVLQADDWGSDERR